MCVFYQSFLSDLCEVPEFHEELQLEEYIALCRKDISIEITVSEIAQLHTLLRKYQANIVSLLDDPLPHIECCAHSVLLKLNGVSTFDTQAG